MGECVVGWDGEAEGTGNFEVWVGCESDLWEQSGGFGIGPRLGWWEEERCGVVVCDGWLERERAACAACGAYGGWEHHSICEGWFWCGRLR